MKVVFLGENDWANTSNAIARAINRGGNGMTARAVTVRAHRFGYEEDVVIQRDGYPAARAAIGGADWIVHSGDGHYDVFAELLDRFAVDRRSVRLATRHAGTRYRSNPVMFNELDREWGFERRFMACDLYRFAIEDPSARVFVKPQDEFAEQVQPVESDVLVCHSPSRRTTKGTDAIVKAIDSLKATTNTHDFEFNIIENLDFRECYRRRGAHHILIDQFNPEVGAYGAAVMESLAQGLAVVTHCGNVVSEVSKWMPLPPVVNVDSTSELKNEVAALIRNPERLQRLREQSLDWAQRTLSSVPVCKYWRFHLDG